VNEIARLREEIDHLRAERDDLRRQLGREHDRRRLEQLRILFDLSPLQARMLDALLIIGMIGKDAILEVYLDGLDNMSTTNSIKNRMVGLRKALAKHDIAIETDWGSGYRMTPAGRRAVEEMLLQATRAGVS
jgi:DNA-binding response OmpR family regulator